MSETTNNNVSIKKTLYGKNTYLNVIDTNFTELVASSSSTTIDLNSLTVSDFFSLYEILFFEIPKFGPTSSHEYLIQQSTEYIGVEKDSEDISALLEEINSLRQQLLDANQTILELTTNTTISNTNDLVTNTA